jgi:hypothetical protein
MIETRGVRCRFVRVVSFPRRACRRSQQSRDARIPKGADADARAGEGFWIVTGARVDKSDAPACLTDM